MLDAAITNPPVVDVTAVSRDAPSVQYEDDVTGPEPSWIVVPVRDPFFPAAGSAPHPPVGAYR